MALHSTSQPVKSNVVRVTDRTTTSTRSHTRVGALNGGSDRTGGSHRCKPIAEEFTCTLIQTDVEGCDMTNNGPETALLTGLGLLLLIYGVVQWTNVFTYTPPAIVYFIAGIVLLLWGISLNRRS